VGDVRTQALFPYLVAASVLISALVLYLTSYRTFYYDEWDYVFHYRPSQSTSIFLGHSEHWSTIPVLIWKLLLRVVGLRTHWPYEAVTLVAHSASVLLLFALVRRRSGDLPAFAAALMLLVLGSGGTDIVWAFQDAWTASVAFGLLAMLLLDREPGFRSRLPLVSLSLLASLMCSGIGLGFLVAVGAQLLVDPPRRRFLVVLILPVAAYGLWFLAYGAGLPGTPGAPCPTCTPSALGADFPTPVGLAYASSVVGFVVTGLQASAAAVVGWPDTWIFLLLFAVLIAVHWYRQGKVEPWQIGLVAGLVAQFLLIALVRVRIGVSSAGASRYVYVGAVYLLPLLVDAARELPWYRFWRPALVAVFAVGLYMNATLLRDSALGQVELMQYEQADLQTMEVFRGAPDMSLDQSPDPTFMPQLNAATYFPAIDELGSPVPKATIGSLRLARAEAVDETMRRLFGPAITTTADNQRSVAGLTCTNIDPATGGASFRVPSGQSVMLQSTQSGDATVFLGFLSAPTPESAAQSHLVAGVREWLHFPDTGLPITWQVEISTTSTGVVKLCSPAA
jgi:hypothetical protein